MSSEESNKMSNKTPSQDSNSKKEQQEESLAKEHDTLIDSFNKTQDGEQKFLDEITKKYGQGTLNPETGVFTPNKSQ